MTHSISSYAFAVFAIAVLALITWGPTLLSFRGKRHRGESVFARQLAVVLAIELAAVVAIAVAADRFGLLNPGGYLLAIALVIGAVGGQIFSKMRFKHDR